VTLSSTGFPDDVAADAGCSAIDGALADLQLLLGKRDDLLFMATGYSRSVGRLTRGKCRFAGLAGFRSAARLFVNIVRPMLIKNAHDGIGVHFIDRGRDNGMPRIDACIVGTVFLRLGRPFAD
jgi:hypothetical protein